MAQDFSVSNDVFILHFAFNLQSLEITTIQHLYGRRKVNTLSVYYMQSTTSHKSLCMCNVNANCTLLNFLYQWYSLQRIPAQTYCTHCILHLASSECACVLLLIFFSSAASRIYTALKCICTRRLSICLSVCLPFNAYFYLSPLKNTS